MALRKELKRWLYGRCPGMAGAFPYFGTRVYFPRGSFSFEAACDQGVFESENVRLITSLVKPGTVYFDVGTNIGLMSVPVLQALANCRVVSFEASPNVLASLSRTVSESVYGERWTLVPKAVGARVGKVAFSLASPENSLFDGLKSTQRVASVREVEVEMTTLDTFWLEAGSPPVSMIKCDVEGAEIQVLNGARACLAAQHPHVLLEWNAQNLAAYECAADALLSFASELGYRVYALPNLVRVDTPLELELHMTATENFLLSPK